MNTSSPTPGRRVAHLLDESLAGQRLDRVVAALHPELSRAAASELIAQDLVRINGHPAKPASRPIVGAQITVDLPEPAQSDAGPERIPIEVVYEDAALVVVNKPAGMVVHPAPGNLTGTLVNALLGRYQGLPGDSTRPGIVHRLDKDTSGLIVVARTPHALATLAGAFKRHQVHKEYLALLIGTPKPETGAIEAPIGRDPRHRQRMAVVSTGGRESRTEYRTEERFTGYALVRALPETGRMHQIRVHFAAKGHPVAGDAVYGRQAPKLGLRRQFLHAALLSFVHPTTGEAMRFEAPLAADLQHAVDLLRAAERR